MSDLKISIVEAAPATVPAPLLVLLHFEDDGELVGAAAEVDQRLGGALARVLARGDFRGRREETLLFYPPDGGLGAERLLLVGLGKRDQYMLEVLRRAVGAAVRQAERIGISGMVVELSHVARLDGRIGAAEAAQAAVEGGVLAAWDYLELKTQAEEEAPRARLESFTLLAQSPEEAAAFERGRQIGQVVAGAANLARELAMRPGNIVTPAYLAEVATQIAQQHRLGLTVLDREAMQREGMGALLAVAQGSEQEPRLIVLEYPGAGDKVAPLALVGKGVTFDSGGISIKPAERMEDMKYDMSGAAAVLGAMRAIAELGLRVNVVGVVPATENLPSGRAVKPGDVVRSHLGKTIEIINTDAEGRLILADALSYVRRYGPQAIVDAATLTGACVIALGHHAAGLMGNDEALVEQIRAAGERSGERCWPLPLWDEYRKQLSSTVADLKNTGGRPAGTITGGWFLKEFVGDIPWVHLDIAGVAYRDEPLPYLRKGPTGAPTRLLIEWVRGRAEG